MLSGVNGASPWAANASESAFCLVETALGRCSSGLLVEWVPSDESSDAGAVSSVPDHPVSGRMVALFWIRSLEFLLLVLGSLLASLRIAGVGVVGVVLNMFGLMVVFILVGASAPFWGPCNPFRELKCGLSFGLFSLLVLCIWGLTI